MISWTKGIVAVLALGATGMGCELILKADRSRIGATTGAGGGTGGAGGVMTTGSSSVASTSTGVGGGTSSSMSTGAPTCVDPKTDCPVPADECSTAVCDGAGLCAVKNTPNGTAIAAQTPGDCKKVVCDGAGKTTSSDDNTDVSDDGLECTTDTCAAGAPVHTPVAVNTACGMAGGSLKCDGAGACVGCVTVADCGMPAACKVNTCTAGACGVANAADATVCDDGDKCTTIDSCKTGVCTGATPVVCGASDQCHGVGICAKATGMCSNPVVGDGNLCNDGNGCTTSDTCMTGVCTGAMPVVCMASDQCHAAGTCTNVGGAGMCSNPPIANGMGCNDANLCTTGDVCTAGNCGGTPVVCTAADACHVPGTCTVATGVCTTPNAPTGMACNDANNCTTGDTCTAGACAGSPVMCMALDSCHNAGACAPATGLCSNPTKGVGAACNDNNLCTSSDICSAAAVCSGTAKVCPAPDQCHLAGTCASATGICSNPAVPNGTVCMNGAVPGTCTAGVCQ